MRGTGGFGHVPTLPHGFTRGEQAVGFGARSMRIAIVSRLTFLIVVVFGFAQLVHAEPNSNNRDPEPDILSTPAHNHYEDDLTRHFDIEPRKVTK